MLLKNKTALVTGGGSGIGRAVALAYAREGANVLAADIAVDDGEATVERIQAAGGSGVFLRLDVTSPEDHAAAVAYARREYGGLHVACNNAGISRGPSGNFPSIADVDPADWARILEVNLSGIFHGLRFQIPAMLEAGGGSIVNIGSVMSQVARPGIGPYVASKHGVVGLTRAAAVDYASQGLRVNAVGPGYVETPILSGRDEAARAAISKLHPMGRMGQPEEVAELVLWLSSSQSSFVTGAYYPVDGGFLAQ